MEHITKGTILLVSAGSLCLFGLDIVGLAVAGYGVFSGEIKVK